MTGEAFERLMCDVFQDLGYWALKIPRNNSGAQPFDILAIKGMSIFAVDCKVCSQARFPLSRIEDNQWTAMKSISSKTDAIVGFMCYYDGNVYMVKYSDVLCAQKSGVASVKLNSSNLLIERNSILEA